MKIPSIEVGILPAKEIHFRLNAPYRRIETGAIVSGEYKITPEDSFPMTFEPISYDEASFDLYDVVIGVQFHWERKETQCFKGTLKLIIENNLVTAINILSLEDYLISVISSEMSATSSLELLKAHAVISRSWLLAQKQKAQELDKSQITYKSIHETKEEYIRWYDREDHENFDVCADDHCQRYQGITKVSTPEARQAVTETSGELLIYDNSICDTRFSKCCGGITEKFENNWEPVVHPYLTRFIDNPIAPEGYDLDLTKEDAAEKWIKGTPPAFCNTHDKEVLSQVLNDYDQETQDFFRWEVSYTQLQIRNLIHQRTGWDFGEIIDLIPVERGDSGRLIKLKIVGTKKTMTIGKELFIRKALSESHLYSSAFIVEKIMDSGKTPSKFILKGAGWGHGVGLCQIGAAVMGAKGCNYKEILTHYFPGAELIKMY